MMNNDEQLYAPTAPALTVMNTNISCEAIPDAKPTAPTAIYEDKDSSKKPLPCLQPQLKQPGYTQLLAAGIKALRPHISSPNTPNTPDINKSPDTNDVLRSLVKITHALHICDFLL